MRSEYMLAQLQRLAEDRGYSRPRWTYGNPLFVQAPDGQTADYVADILAPRGIVPHDYRIVDLADAIRLMGLLPPAR